LPRSSYAFDDHRVRPDIDQRLKVQGIDAARVDALKASFAFYD